MLHLYPGGAFSLPGQRTARHPLNRAHQTVDEVTSLPTPFKLYGNTPDQDGCSLNAVGKFTGRQRCEYATGRIYGFKGNFWQHRIDLEEKILSLGWKTDERDH
jgi:hypothetical protein